VPSCAVLSLAILVAYLCAGTVKGFGCLAFTCHELHVITITETLMCFKITDKKVIPLHAMKAHGGRGGIAPTHT
jgi:hypothetical protein